MATRVDPTFLKDLKAYGAVNIEDCFNCGNCTAVCSLTTDSDNFPRKMIRYAQLGMRDKLVGSKELWLCYNCGDCSETCPRQAEPASFLMASRSYAIANYDFFGLGKFLSSKPWLGGIFLILLSIVSGLFIYTRTEAMPTDTVKLFDFLPYEFVHTAGLALIILVGLLGVAVILNMLVQFSRINDLKVRSFFQAGPKAIWNALWESIAVQALWQKRFRETCEGQQDEEPWFLRKWFVHAAMLWGFLGLVAATGLDYLLDILGVKPTGTFVPIWYPVRLLGTVTGLLLVYGATVVIIKRLKQTDKAHSNSSFSDWVFLILLWLAGVTGFVVELSLYTTPGTWGYWALIVHVTFSMELILLLPFTKFAHSILRTAALFVHTLKPEPVGNLAEQPASAD
jgi:ferredoxin